MKNLFHYMSSLLLLLCFLPHLIHSMTEDSEEEFPPAEVAFEVYSDKTNTQKETKNVSGEFLTKRLKRAQGRVVWFRSSSCTEIDMDEQDGAVRNSDEERIAFAPLDCLLNDESIKRMNLSLYKAVIAHRQTDVHNSNSPFLHTYRVHLQGLTVADLLVVMLERVESKLLNSIKTNEFVVDAKIQPPRTEAMMNGDSATDTRKYPLHIASIIFVSVSFLILVLVSLTWLGFYYMQRFQISQYEYNGRRRHRITIKKAVDLIPTRTLKKEDPLVITKRSCAICIETFSTSEHIRELVCKHCFHKTCVDPWLLSKHTCPLCKHNIVTSTPKNPQGVENHGVTVSDENLPPTTRQVGSSSHEMNQLNQHPSAINNEEQSSSSSTTITSAASSNHQDSSDINFIPASTPPVTTQVDSTSQV